MICQTYLFFSRCCLHCKVQCVHCRPEKKQKHTEAERGNHGTDLKMDENRSIWRLNLCMRVSVSTSMVRKSKSIYIDVALICAMCDVSFSCVWPGLSLPDKKK